MARPKDKSSLVRLSNTNYNKLRNFINELDQETPNRQFPEGYLNKNVRDVIAHLHHWHLMTIKWYTVGMAGKKPKMPAEGYTWHTVPALNIEINKLYNSRPLELIVIDLENSFNELQEIINRHSDAELFTKEKYHWTGSTSLAAYLISATSSHYEWGLKLIKNV